MREARCGCGSLKLSAEGEPAMVIQCHCEECQRRTGAPAGVGAYFPEAQVTVTGEEKTYTRSSDAGRSLTNHFCPTCGTTLYWDAEAFDGIYGVAVGCFNDPAFPPPGRAVYTVRKHDWVELLDGIDVFERGSMG